MLYVQSNTTNLKKILGSNAREDFEKTKIFLFPFHWIFHHHIFLVLFLTFFYLSICSLFYLSLSLISLLPPPSFFPLCLPSSPFTFFPLFLFIFYFPSLCLSLSSKLPRCLSFFLPLSVPLFLSTLSLFCSLWLAFLVCLCNQAPRSLFQYFFSLKINVFDDCFKRKQKI